MKRSASLRAACLAAATALALVPSAHAARVSATGTVRGGGLTANAPEGPIALSRSAADGQRRFFVPVTVTDARGTGEGWRLIVEADPDTGSGVRLLATGASATCASGPARGHGLRERPDREVATPRGGVAREASRPSKLSPSRTPHA